MNVLDTKTAIIGAGISGISAGVNLLENGYKNFLIFEANDRIGGRCHTINYNDEILEYGAQFIHGQVNNPIYKIAIENKLISDEYKQILYESEDDLTKYNGLKINFEEEEKMQIFCTDKGQKLDNELIEKIYNCLNKSVRLAESYFLSNKNEQDCNLGDFLYKSFLDFVKEEELDSKIDEDLLISLFKWRCKWENIENSCSSVCEMSLNNFSNYIELKGSQIMELTKGYKSLIDKLIEKYKDEFYNNLNLNHSLVKILLCQNLEKNSESADCEHCQYSSDLNKIVLLFENNTIVLCEHVICTMSLGFLKHNINYLIKPNRFVPKTKLTSISRLGYGTVNKIILVYDEPFWEKNLEGINLIWSSKESNLFDDLNHVNFELETRWIEDICSFEPAINHKNILIGWIGGNSYHESLNDQQVSNQCTILLRKFLNNPNIPEPKNVIRSKWYSNPFFRGSYSFFTYGSDKTDMQYLAEPICFNDRPFIQFAGEATHLEHYSTVHGAYLTGLRESNRILNH